MAKKKQKEEVFIDLQVETEVKPALSEGMQKLTNILKEIDSIVEPIDLELLNESFIETVETIEETIVTFEAEEIIDLKVNVISKDELTILEIKSYLDYYLNDWETNNKGLNEKMFKHKSLSDNKQNLALRTFFTKITGIKFTGCNCGRTYIKVLQKLKDHLTKLTK